jgi:hypothetical protein
MKFRRCCGQAPLKPYGTAFSSTDGASVSGLAMV